VDNLVKVPAVLMSRPKNVDVRLFFFQPVDFILTDIADSDLGYERLRKRFVDVIRD
jgi:hypothetical protein